MPISDIYVAPSGLITLASAVETPILSLFGVSTKRVWAIACRIKVDNTAAAAGNNIRFRLARPGNTPTATGLASPNAHDFSAPAGLAQFATTWSTAPTVGAVLADWEVPMVSGQPYTEYPIPGAEWGVPAIANAAANAGIHLFATPSVATSVKFSADLLESE
jgi:hypothetical protein